MDSKSKKLLYATFILVIISIALTYNKYILKNDFTIIPVSEESTELE